MDKQASVKEKNKAAIERQREMRATTKREQANSRITRFQGLTKRNEEYMCHLDKALTQKHYDPAKKEEVLTQMLAELKEKQKTGATAVKSYGTVTERVDIIINGKKVDKEATGKEVDKRNFWHIALDNGVMMFMMFCLLFGIFGLFKTRQSPANGIISIVLMSVVTGLSMAYFYKVMVYQRKSWGRVIVTIIELVAAWLLICGILSKIPANINVVLPSVVYLIIGIVILLIRLLFGKQLGFKSILNK